MKKDSITVGQHWANQKNKGRGRSSILGKEKGPEDEAKAVEIGQERGRGMGDMDDGQILLILTQNQPVLCVLELPRAL